MLLFLITAVVVGVYGLVSGPNWDKLTLAILFVAVANLIRTIGIYRHRLGLE